MLRYIRGSCWKQFIITLDSNYFLRWLGRKGGLVWKFRDLFGDLRGKTRENEEAKNDAKKHF